MAQCHYGLVCTGRGDRRVSSGAGCSTPSLPCANSNAVVSGLRAGAVSSKRDNLLVEQGSGRGTRHGDALSGVLQKVPKKDGTFRPVFNLKSLYVYVRKEKFKMTTPRAVTHALHKGDWVVSVDLKDAYFHVPIHRKSRRLLRFAVEGSDGVRVFQFRALPFGLTFAPRAFTKVILHIGHLAHVHAVCLLQYLDDWIVRNTDKSLLQQQAKWLLGVLRRVGIVLNAQKSQVVLHNA